MPTEVIDNAVSAGTQAQLLSPVQATDTVLPVDGPASPILQGGQFRVVVIDALDGGAEVMLVTSNQWTSNWTAERSVEGPPARAFAAGSVVRHILTATGLQTIIQQAIGATSFVSKNASYNMATTDEYVGVKGLTANAVIETPPSANLQAGHMIGIADEDGSGLSYSITITTSDRKTIDGQPSITLHPYGGVLLVLNDAGNWNIYANGNIPPAWQALTLAAGITVTTTGSYDPTPSALVDYRTALVHLKGNITNSSGGTLAAGSLVFTVPANAIPAYTRRINAYAQILDTLLIQGKPTPSPGQGLQEGNWPSTDYMCLDGLSYAL